MSTVSEKGTEQPVSRWQNVNPAETSSGRSTGLSAVLIPRSFVLRRSADVCSSFSRSLLSPRAEEQKRQHILTSHTSQMDGHQCADNELHACVIIKKRFCPLFDLVSKRSCSIFFFFFVAYTRQICRKDMFQWRIKYECQLESGTEFTVLKAVM